MKWTGMHRAPTPQRHSCRYGCGTTVDMFRDDIGLDRQLETGPVPANLDLTHPRHRERLWEHHGAVLGWSPKFFPTRTGREIRLEHDCEATPERKRKHAHKHTKEHTP